MNQAVPPEDCGDRSGDSGGPSQSARAVSRAVGLVGRVADPQRVADVRVTCGEVHRDERETMPAIDASGSTSGCGLSSEGSMRTAWWSRCGGDPARMAEATRFRGDGQREFGGNYGSRLRNELLQTSLLLAGPRSARSSGVGLKASARRETPPGMKPPDRNPRRECGSQFVALSSSLAVMPPGRFSSSRIVAVLLPSQISFERPGALPSSGQPSFPPWLWRALRQRRPFWGPSSQ